MILHDNFTFPHAYYGQPKYGSFDRAMSVQNWWGVVGAQILLSTNATREITVEATLANYPTLVSFSYATVLIQHALRIGLAGKLGITGIIYPQCTFVDWTPAAPAFWDGSGIHGWVQQGTLKWVQIMY